MLAATLHVATPLSRSLRHSPSLDLDVLRKLALLGWQSQDQSLGSEPLRALGRGRGDASVRVAREPTHAAKLPRYNYPRAYALRYGITSHP